ncbi:MAG TPA: hypothetical protein VNV17_16095 [Solirubrobacteraceae bacterium]|nr:hypothetical protein [Solirubrobacteraceae bacterium]
MIRRLTLVCALCALLVSAATAQAASIWTPVSSGTSSTINSIVYQSPTRFWYATSSGTIAFWNGSSFTPATGITPGENFVDLAFQPAGSVGYAVTSNGHVWRSINSGASWTSISPNPSTRSDCTSATLAAESELNSVQWANSTTVYLLGNNSTIIRSTNADTAGTPTFNEVNKLATGTCAIQNEPFAEDFSDSTFLPTNPADAFFVAKSFGRLYQTSNALSGSVSGNLASDGTVNSFTGNPRIAQDPGSTNRIWVADHESGGSCGTLCLQVSTDGGTTAAAATFPNDSTVTGNLFDISSQGGVEVTAGSGGEIFTSPDGTNFYNQPADGALATENWRAEAAFDGAHAAVGGENGALAVTAASNTIPDIVAPTGTISGPTTATSGRATGYTAVLADNTGGTGINPASITWTAAGFAAQHGATAAFAFPRGVGSVTLTLSFADNAGNQGTATLNVTVRDAPPPGPPSGSQPTTVTTGGGTIKVFKVVTVTGRNARFIPVIVSATKPRKFIAQLLPAKGKKKALATGRITFKRKHGGHGTLRVKLPATVKPGKYVIVVRETTLKGKKVGKLVKVKFTLK